jgi:transposase-like protein
MSKSLTPAVRRQIIAFNPAEPGASSVSEFCRELGISRPSFYNVRERFAREGNAALNPRSRAPQEPARRYTEDTVQVVLGVRKQLTGNGWDAGPISIWHACVDEGLFTSLIPSVSTIARVLAEAGVVDANPRKRPRSSYIRFQRSEAMELWQFDGLQYSLFDDTGRGDPVKITIYQLLDDSTRYDVGT